MKLWVLAKHLLIAAALVAGLALAACESSGGGLDGSGSGSDTSGGGSDTVTPPLQDVPGGGGDATAGCDPACGAGFQCVANACVPVVVGCDPPCGVGSECVDNECVALTPCDPPCGAGYVCEGGQCVAEPDCSPACAPGFVCENGQCVSQCSCDGKQCGDDGCGGTCGACDAGYVCNASNQCECAPDCTLMECGLDPICETSCGECEAGVTCTNGQCPVAGCPDIAEQHCQGKQCGPDTCGGFCGQCDAGQRCNADQFCECAPQCGGKVCGSDGCGGNCGSCQTGTVCNADGTACEQTAAPGGACIDWFDCFADCPNGPDQQQCVIECDEQLTPSGLNAKNAFLACQTNTCGHCTSNECLNDCVFTECRTVYAACYGSAGMGAGTCDDYFGCQNDCPDFQADPAGFEACDRACMTQTSEAGLTAAYDVLFCVSANCDETNWTACVNAALSEGGVCYTEGTTCFGEQNIEWCDPATSTCLSCGEMIQCLNGCGGDDECSNNCFTSASEDTYFNGYEPIINCLIENCPGGDIANCDQQSLLSGDGACAAAWNNCTGGTTTPDPCDPADHPDDPDYCLSCSGIITCINGCADANCQTECVNRADAEATPIFSAFIECLFTECPNGDAACQQSAQQGACAASLQACIGDTKAAPRAVVFALSLRTSCQATATVARTLPRALPKFRGVSISK